MRRLEVYWRRDTSLQSLQPPRHAKAPAVALLQAGKVGMRCDEVIAARTGESEELLRHSCANRVQPGVAWTSAAIAIAVEACERIATAAAQVCAQDVCRHDAPYHVFVAYIDQFVDSSASGLISSGRSLKPSIPMTIVPQHPQVDKSPVAGRGGPMDFWLAAFGPNGHK